MIGPTPLSTNGSMFARELLPARLERAMTNPTQTQNQAGRIRGNGGPDPNRWKPIFWIAAAYNISAATVALLTPEFHVAQFFGTTAAFEGPVARLYTQAFWVSVLSVVGCIRQDLRIRRLRQRLAHRFDECLRAGGRHRRPRLRHGIRLVPMAGEHHAGARLGGLDSLEQILHPNYPH